MCIERVQRDGKPCPLCNEPKFTTLLHKKLVREVNALVVRCPQKELGCDWLGELGQLQCHLNPGAGVVSSKGCGFVLVECAYQCGAQLQRRLLQEHEMEICSKRPIEMQVASLMQKFETIKIEFKTVSTENQQLRQELEKVQKIHKEEMNQMKQELDEVKGKNDLLQKANNEMHDDLKRMRNDIDKQKSKSDDLEKSHISLQTHTMPLPVPPFYFSMTHFDHHQKNSLIYRSTPFYSHPGGYKLSMVVLPDGFGDSRGLCMSVYVSILRGEFDDQLHWPFNGTIIVQAYNRSTKKWSNECTIVMNKENCNQDCIKRCVNKFANVTWGCASFLPLPELKRHYLIDKNIVRFQVTKVEHL